MAGTDRTTRHHLAAVLITGLVAALLGTGLVSAPAHAVVLPAPTGLTPTSGDFQTNPTLSWNRVDGASTYRVELSTNDTFTALISGAGTGSTTNVNFVPPVPLPAGTVYWRVAANGSESTNFSVGSFTRSAIGVPQLLTPADNGVIHAPTEPAAYTWQVVPGAISYNIQIGDDPTFTDPARYIEYSTRRAAHTLKALPAQGVRYWRVQALLSPTIKSDWSSVRSVDIRLFDLEIPQSPTSPVNDPLAGVDDIELDWVPIAGATTYDLEIATDDQFLNIVHSRTGIVGSRYSPPGVLHNDQYWWRIRPADAANHKASWDAMPKWTFQRHWTDQAHLQYPADGGTLTDPDRVFFQWSGVHLATSYRFDISSSPDFSVATTRSCTTVSTTFTPNWNNTAASSCAPVVGTTYWWRVVANDSPAAGTATPQTNPFSGTSEVRTFTFSPTVVDGLAPVDGGVVDVPTLRWAPVSGAWRYRVQVWSNTDGSLKLNTLTYGTSLTPRTVLPAGVEYRWQVEALSASGAQISNPLIPLFQDRFTVVAQMGPTGSSPDAFGSPMAPTPRVPTMSWTRVTEATQYTLRIKREENPTWTTQITGIGYPAGETWDASNLNAGTYDFQVEAFKGNVSLGLGAPGTFTVAPARIVTGHNAALVGTDIDSADPARACNAELPNTCQNLRQTPVLAWESDPDAAFYQLILSADPVLTDSVDRRIYVYGTTWTDLATFADANASTGTYWAVISCKSANPEVCPVTGPAGHAFNKQAPGVALDAPANGSVHPYEVTLDWHDWLAQPGPGSGSTPLTGTAPTTEARHYQVQTSATATFTTVLDSEFVDQTSFTSFTRVYPDGPIYWRVRAYDGTNRPGAWSDTRNFTVTSPAPTPLSPAVAGTFGPGSAFTWEPRQLATSYELKVLKNDGSSIETAPTGSIALWEQGIQQSSFAPTGSLKVEPLDPDGNNYRWFIRRKTISNGVGPWSAGTPFRVVAQVPALQSPAAGAQVAPRGTVFSWGALSGAKEYRVEDRAVGGATGWVTTVATAHAPTVVIPAGPREWRVVAYDATGNVLGASGWRAYSAPPISGSVSISGQAKIGGTLTALVGAWQPDPVVESLQWYAAGVAIAGATSATYTVTSADVGKAIYVKVTGSKAGYDALTLTSNAITATATLAVTNSAKPVISGTTRIGYTLTASPGTWSPAPDSYSYQWLRSGTAIAGATTSTYKVTPADPGRNLTVRVTARKSGYTTGVATSVAKLVPRVTTTTSVSFVDPTITATTYPQMRVTVAAPGILHPSGTVRIYEGSTLLKTVTLGATSAGKVTVTLPRRTRGSHYLYAKYLGSSYTLPAQSPKILLSVR